MLPINLTAAVLEVVQVSALLRVLLNNVLLRRLIGTRYLEKKVAVCMEPGARNTNLGSFLI